MKTDTHMEQAFLSVEPLLAMFDGDERNEKMGYIAEQIGSTNRTIVRWKTQGIGLFAAEKIAETLGCHPSHIWGADYHTAVYYEGVRSENIYRAKLERQRKREQKIRDDEKLKKMQNAK